MSYTSIDTVTDFVNNADKLDLPPVEFAAWFRDFHVRHNIAKHYATAPPGSFMAQHTDRRYRRYFYFDNFDAAKANHRREIKKHNRKISITPSERKQYKMAQAALKKSCATYREFLAACAQGHLDYRIIRDLAEDTFKGNQFKAVEFGRTDRKFDPLVFITPHIYSFEDALNVFGIFWHLTARHSFVFEEIRQCPQCERFHRPVNPKGRFCSNQCKDAHYYLQRKQQRGN